MINLHKSLSNLPIIIVINWAICALFFTHSEFYFNNFELLDNLDTIIVYLSLMHFLWMPKIYSKEKKYFIFTIISSIILRISFEKLLTEVYYYLYFSIILMPFIIILWKMKEKK